MPIRNKIFFCKFLLCLLIGFGKISFAVSGTVQKIDHGQVLISADASALSEAATTESVGVQDEPAVNLDCEARFIKPANALDFLGNLKKVLTGGYLMDRQFYSRECLGNITGGDATDFLAGKSNSELWVYGREFGVNDSARKPDDFYGQGFSAHAKLERGDVADGLINISFVAGKGPGFNEICEIFGSNWREDKSPPLHGWREPVTGPHGHEKLGMEIPSNGERRTVNVIFNADGTLMNIFIEGRK